MISYLKWGREASGVINDMYSKKQMIEEEAVSEASSIAHKIDSDLKRVIKEAEHSDSAHTLDEAENLLKTL